MDQDQRHPPALQVHRIWWNDIDPSSRLLGLPVVKAFPFHAARTAFARSILASCSRRISATLVCRLRSTWVRARRVASMPGVLPVPEKPAMTVQHVIGCVNDVDAFTRRAVPIRLEAIPIKGTATCPLVTPAPSAARSIHSRHGSEKTSTGNSGKSPRRSSKILQSGRGHELALLSAPSAFKRRSHSFDVGSRIFACLEIHLITRWLKSEFEIFGINVVTSRPAATHRARHSSLAR